MGRGGQAGQAVGAGRAGGRAGRGRREGAGGTKSEQGIWNLGLTGQIAKAAENEHLMQELMCWDAGFSGVDHYGCQTLQHRHVGAKWVPRCLAEEMSRKKLGWITRPRKRVDVVGMRKKVDMGETGCTSKQGGGGGQNQTCFITRAVTGSPHTPRSPTGAQGIAHGTFLTTSKITSQRLLDQSQAGIYMGKTPHTPPFWPF